MTPQSALEIKGQLTLHPFAEILAEIAAGQMNGSLRVSSAEKKCVVYFRSGSVVFAASNARSTRLFETILRRGKLTKDELVKIPDFSNDFELTDFLLKDQRITEAERDQLFREQVQGIIVDMLGWQDGEWIFSPLARVREGLSFDIDTRSVLMQYGRCLPNELTESRFRSVDETFRRSELSEFGNDLTLEEGFILSRTDEIPISIADLVVISALPQPVILKHLYMLWLGGWLIRGNWSPAFSSNVIAAINSAKLELKAVIKPAPAKPVSPPEESIHETSPPATKVDDPPEKETDAIATLDDYLNRVEKAVTYYDVLGIDVKEDLAEVKRAYFLHAKNFHPDKFHFEGGDTLKRIQHAFTELAQAYETLKNAESREVYDYRMRKELADRERRASTGESGTEQHAREQATENFDRGFSLFMENDVESALPYFARAAHFSPKTAKYRAYYGRTLAFDETKRHKAEAEMQAAIKIDPDNASFRIMLAEFFIQYNLMKRAEGELNRLLAIFPSNREARELLDSLKAPAR